MIICNKSNRKKSSSTDKLIEDAVNKTKYVEDEKKKTGRKNISEITENDIMDVPACPDIGPVV